MPLPEEVVVAVDHPAVAEAGVHLALGSAVLCSCLQQLESISGAPNERRGSRVYVTAKAVVGPVLLPFGKTRT
jgi:hypothetical protein